VNVGFLIGAGVSSAAGMPSAAEMTERVRSGTDVINPGVGFRIGEPPLTENFIYTGPVMPVVAFVGALADLAEAFYALREPERKVNYEDICYLARQIVDALMFEYENPALLPLIVAVQCANPGRTTSPGSTRGLRGCPRDSPCSPPTEVGG
jgi:hypothetical protein